MALTAAFTALVEEARIRIQTTDITGYRDLVASGEKFTLIDVREDNEWEKGHAAGAMHLGKGIIERDIESVVPDQSEKLVLYCGGGYRSVLAADNLRKMGYSNPISLNGGWKAWVSAGLPVEK